MYTKKYNCICVNQKSVKNPTLFLIGKKKRIDSFVWMLWQWNTWVYVRRVHHQKGPFPEVDYF
jgi:hypothetical protein